MKADVVASSPNVEAPALRVVFNFSFQRQQEIELDTLTEFSVSLRKFLIENNDLGDVEEKIVAIDQFDDEG